MLNSERIIGFKRVPVTQDASASAYQIMSYLLLNAELGRRTNLLPSPDEEIQDFYLSLKDELQEFLHSRVDTDKYAIIESGLTRTLVKRLFMPLIYGKTIMTMASDIREVYGSLLSFKDHWNIAELCYEFWINKYPDIANLMKLINLIGWFCSALGKPVNYNISYFTTVQDYMRSKKAEISIYERKCKKRRRVTLRVPTGQRDKRKTQVATCVNFIHQRDAFIAMKVVEKLANETKGKAPVYTVHDNFITTSVYAARVPNIYTQVFMDMGPPLEILNNFIQKNLNQLKRDHSMNAIAPGHMTGKSLRSILKSLAPPEEDVSNTENEKWSKKIDDIVSCYEKYVNTVCGEAMDEMHHIEKWNEFQFLLQSWRNLGFNYSLHY